MFAATALYQSEYFSGGTGVNPLPASYSRCAAYGGEVITRFARVPANRRCTTSRSRQSPQIRRCLPTSQVSPARVTGSAGGSGISSSSASSAFEASASARSTRNSSLLKPNSCRSMSASLSSANWIDAQQLQVNVGISQFCQLDREQLVVVSTEFGQLVVSQNVGSLLNLAEVIQNNHRHHLQAQL